LPVGNNGDLSHFAPSGHHPSEADREWKEFQEHGEIDYMKHKKQQALDFIRARPGWFMWATTRRALYRWTSFWSFDRHYLEQETYRSADRLPVYRADCAGAGRTVACVPRQAVSRHASCHRHVLFPARLLLTHEENYYRRPIDSIFVLLAVYAVTSWKASKRADKETLAEVHHS
jgi:hypothetical protein